MNHNSYYYSWQGGPGSNDNEDVTLHTTELQN